MDFIFDIETTGLHISDQWVCMAWASSYKNEPEVTFDIKEALEVLLAAIGDGDRLVGHNIICLSLIHI